MGHSFRKEEQHLLEMAADFLTRMTELEKLRVAVDLAEAAQALQLEELQRRPRQGVMDPGLLYESSFTYVAPTGPEQLFGEEKVTQTVRQDRRNKSKCRGLDTR